MAKANQDCRLFDPGEWWEDEWQDMPEFVHEDQTSWKAVIVHLKDRDAMDAFSKAIGQKITAETRSLWFPPAEIGRYADKRYVAE